MFMKGFMQPKFLFWVVLHLLQGYRLLNRIYICPIIIQHSKMTVIPENLRDPYSHDASVTCETAMIACQHPLTSASPFLTCGLAHLDITSCLPLTAQHFTQSPHTTHDSRLFFSFWGDELSLFKKMFRKLYYGSDVSGLYTFWYTRVMSH